MSCTPGKRVARFVSDDHCNWGSTTALASTAEYFMQAWRVGNCYAHNAGSTLHVLSASEMGRGADGSIAVADGLFLYVMHMVRHDIMLQVVRVTFSIDYMYSSNNMLHF